MKKILVSLCCLCLSMPVWAQASSVMEPSPVRMPGEGAEQAPASSIDLLRQSVQTTGTNIQSVSSGGAASYTEGNDIPVTPALAADQPVAPAPAVASPKPTAKAAVTPRPANVSAQRAAARKPAIRKPAAKKTASTPSPTVKPTLAPKTEEEILQEELDRTEAELAAAGTPTTPQERKAHAELEQMARLLREGQATLKAARQQNPTPEPTPVATVLPASSSRAYHPNDYRPGVQWERRDSTRFTIYTQKRNKGGITSSNLGMVFETAYETLRRYIPWMMSDKVRVFVYQDHESYLNFEPNAKPYSRALAYPTRGEIVVYDEPGKQQELKEVFTHELVHIFTQKFFNKHYMDKIVTPAWLDEGLAVLIEDQAYAGTKGGPWNNDFLTLNFQQSPQTASPSALGSSRMFGSSSRMTTQRNPRSGKPLYFAPFNEFIKEDSLSAYTAQGKTQDWYFQAYMMVRFLLNPSNSVSPSKRMQFQQFTQLLAQGEQVRDPNTGFPLKDRKGRPVYQLYSVERALARAYRYNTLENLEDAFWRWVDSERAKAPAPGSR